MAGLFITGLVALGMMMTLLIVGVIVTMPFRGALVRLRANYNPRAVGLDGAENTVGPRLTGLFSTMARTYRLEGWYGLYKGAYASVALTFMLSVVSILLVGASAKKGPKGTYVVPQKGGFAMFAMMVVMSFITLPMSIIINRSIITPYRLPTNLRESLRILLSAHERSHPLALYTTPGLLPAVALMTAMSVLIAGGFRLLVIGAGSDKHMEVATWRLAIFVVFQIISTLWLCPVQVVIVKISVQPNLGGEISVEDPEGDVPEGLRFIGQNEDVVGLRPTTDPYMGLVDAVRKIVDEEGWQALYRGWWWTTLGAAFAAF